MLGAIIGDVIGSPYEFDSGKTKDNILFVPRCRTTDDSVLTIAVGCACAEKDRFLAPIWKHSCKNGDNSMQGRRGGYIQELIFVQDFLWLQRVKG